MVSRLVIIIAAIWLPFWYWSDSTDRLRVSLLDVGQGLSILFDDHGWQLLFDGGPDSKVLAELGQTLSALDDSIDVVAVSHLHRDHFVGLIEVLRRYKVGELWITQKENDDPAWQELLNVADERHIPLLLVQEGMVRYLPSGKFIRFFHPPQNPRGEKAHDYSMILTINHLDSDLAQNNFLLTKTDLILTGDSEISHESYVIDHCLKSVILTCPTAGSILQIGHHGSKTSTGETWLNQIRPSRVLIGVGVDNSYNHPAPEVVKRLELRQIPISRTDQNGQTRLDLKPGSSYK